MPKGLEILNIVAGAVPIDTTGAAVSGDYVSLKDYRRCLVVISQGAWAGGTPAVTLLQATDVTNSASDEKTLSFTKKWTKTGLTGTVWTEATVSSDTFNLTTTANTITVLDVNAADLDADNGFDCMRVNVATPGANADLISVIYILLEPRFGQAPAVMIDPLVN
jgi:hypothetical protein